MKTFLIVCVQLAAVVVWFAFVKAPAMGRETGDAMFAEHAASAMPPQVAAAATSPVPSPADSSVPGSAAHAPDAPKRLSLKPSVSAFKSWFQKMDIVFEQNTPLADGTPRLMGKHADGYTMVELIGHGETLERASVMMGLVKEAAPLARNTGAIMIFMRETGWETGWKWATTSIGKGRVTQRHGNVDYVMQTIGDTGVLRIVGRSGRRAAQLGCCTQVAPSVELGAGYNSRNSILTDACQLSNELLHSSLTDTTLSFFLRVLLP